MDAQRARARSGHHGAWLSESSARTAADHRERATPEKAAPEKAEKSALAEHTLRHHPGSHSMSNFKLTIYDQFKPSELDKGESILIEKLRTNVLGLNRMKVQGK